MNEMKYKNAWLELIEIFGGALDGIEWSVDEGSSQASRDIRIYGEIEKMINKIAK